ncbi:MAG: hypothetical protein I3270_01380 [Candidatus Moeniiplasma glomeromycotorum]|nr:hypothetical protein [Candidatus Moeniiplasma glomeromycotorum]MCE8162360.1 hypothetical protein [Candidatus Moeniiplasma glomeromycotorum]MCE8166284.1 hypothetical protein [Candidatus Moeniiplasma glomeromycotorum]MCE8166766.1 hypothetical protein [Candidatus Moeniiplasma glomeromycotorum]
MGNNQSGGEIAAEVGKKVGTIALAASFFTPIGPVTGALTAGALVTGGTVEIIGRATDDEEAKKVGKWFRELGMDATIDGISGGAIDGIKTCGTLIKVAKTGCEAYSAASDETFRHGIASPSLSSVPNPDPKMTLFLAKNIKNIF